MINVNAAYLANCLHSAIFGNIFRGMAVRLSSTPRRARVERR